MDRSIARGLAALFAVWFAWLAVVPAADAADAALETAPAWTLKTPNGETVHFPQDAQHQPSVLLFWPSWCPYSRALQPYVQSIWEDYRDAGVHVWTINIMENGDPVQAMKARGLSFPLLLNGDPLVATYGITRTPWLVVVDGDDHIVYTRPAHPGSPINVAKQVRTTLNGLLGEHAVPLPASYPPAYDLHLRQKVTQPAPDAEWKAWALQYLGSVGADEKVADIAPLGPVSDGRQVIEIARKLWTERYGEEQVAIQGPFRSYRWNQRWVVSGLASAGHLGEGFILVVDASTGQVLRISPGSGRS
ncbi:NTF2 fold immunity protein [Solimonas marina]|uniref:Redoxin domain-containing protein n=1 Tax=Solimonas marina TaxID=2714601 RepID=A0A970BBM5_9GAMM|nr:NTF2 fold immunity protein [Solimonas marina]NKF24606.1 redoxin domain-containing protein [Solimonas marina]